MILTLSLIALFLLLAGLADGICDAWRDGKEPLPSLKLKYPLWYAGSRITGISPYENNGNPFQSDFWHNVKLVRVYSYCCAIGVALGLWWILAIPAFAFITGKAFDLSYHNL